MVPFSALFMAAVANAHLFLQTPQPIQGSAVKPPLAADGSDFPCHGVAFPGAGGVSMPAGSTQPLVIDAGQGANTATHGGGSCQISITYETEKAKIRDPKNWYVILSIEGGCPTNSPANLDANYLGPNGPYSGAWQCSNATTNGFDCINSFNFQIPQGMKNGQATLAWSWFNTIGNREMYMDCVAIDITGGASDTKQMQDLPGLFVANLAASDLPSDCRSTERTNLAFPQPGPLLEFRKPSPRMAVASAASQFPLATPSSCPNMARNGDVQTSVISGGDAVSDNSNRPAFMNDSVVEGSATGAAPTTFHGADAGAVVDSQSFESSVESTQPTTQDSPGPNGCAAGSVPCTVPGALVCPDSRHFGLCDINNCAVVAAVAAGTQCKNGAIAFAGAQKRGALRERLVRHAAHRHHRRS